MQCRFVGVVEEATVTGGWSAVTHGHRPLPGLHELRDMDRAQKKPLNSCGPSRCKVPLAFPETRCVGQQVEVSPQIRANHVRRGGPDPESDKRPQSCRTPSESASLGFIHHSNVLCFKDFLQYAHGLCW